MNLALEMAIEVQRTLFYINALKSIPVQQLQAEARLAKKLSDMFGTIGNSVLAELKKKGTVPSGEMSRSSLLKFLKDAKRTYEKIMQDMAIQSGVQGAQRMAGELKAAGTAQAMSKLNKLDKIISNLPSDGNGDKLRIKAFEASKITMDRVTGNVEHNLLESYEQGLGQDEAAERLNKVFQNLQGHEAQRIARTEINSFQNEGAQICMESLGIEYEQWWTAEDERVRGNRETDTADHVIMHGQIIKVGGTFSNGLQYPGDKAGPIEEWINCRCRVVPFLMPEGYIAPPDEIYFYENDLLKIKQVEEEKARMEAEGKEARRKVK